MAKVQFEKQGDQYIIGGVAYVKSTGVAKEGGYVVALVNEDDLVEGRVYKVTRVSDSGLVDVLDDVDDFHFLTSAEYVVLEPVATAPSLSVIEAELAATKAKVAELEAQLAEVKRKEAEAQRLKVGDYAKVVANDAGHDAEIGDIVKIVVDDRSDLTFKCEDLNGEIFDAPWFCETDLVRATDEEIAEAKRKLAKASFKVGDKVRLLSGGGEFPLIGLTNGEIYTVREDDDRTHARAGRVRVGDGYALPEQLVKVSAEEAEEAEKWVAIGRKPGEFKVGDIAKITRYQYGLPEGTIFAVTGIKRKKTVETPGGYGADVDCIELVAPVESVVNLRVS